MSTQSQSVFQGLPQGATPFQIVAAINQLLVGKLNINATLTLATSATTTTLTDARIGPNSALLLTPTTANAAGEIGAGTIYVSARSKGSATFTHASNSEADRTYTVTIIG